MSSRPVETSSAPNAGRPHLPPVAQTVGTGRSRSRKAPLAWLPWVLLGLLLLTLIGVALLARAADGSGSADRGAGTDAAAGQQAADTGPLTADGQDLVRLAGRGLAPLAGRPAQGTARVESVVADEGFWVGTGARERVFVFLTPEARRSAGESGFQVEAGQTVSLKGTVKGSSPEFARSAGVTEAEGARQLVEQGGYVEVTEVRLGQ